MPKVTKEPNENMPHRKQSATSSKSVSFKRSNHKHEYERIIVQDFFWYSWGGRCKICGRYKRPGSFFSGARNQDFMKPGTSHSNGISSDDYLSVEELHEKFPNTPICKYDYETFELVEL